MKCEEAQELITALVDEELSDLEQAAIEGHLKDCPRCRWAYEQEQTLKGEIHKVGARVSVPAELNRKILADYSVAPTELESSREWRKVVLPFHLFLRPAFSLTLLLIAVLPLIYLIQRHNQPLSLATLDIEQKIMEGELSLQTARNQNELRDWQIRAVNGKFAPMGYYLSSMQFQAVGGLVQDVNSRRVLVTVFKGPGASVTCFTFLGTEEDVPKDATVFFDQERNINFYTFSRNGYNAVLHQKDNVTCILVSTMSTEELLDLARS